MLMEKRLCLSEDQAANEQNGTPNPYLSPSVVTERVTEFDEYLL